MIASHRLLSPALVARVGGRLWKRFKRNPLRTPRSSSPMPEARMRHREERRRRDVAAPDSPGDAVAEPEPIPDAVVVIDMAHPAGPVNSGDPRERDGMVQSGRLHSEGRHVGIRFGDAGPAPPIAAIYAAVPGRVAQ